MELNDGRIRLEGKEVRREGWGVKAHIINGSVLSLYQALDLVDLIAWVAQLAHADGLLYGKG